MFGYRNAAVNVSSVTAASRTPARPDAVGPARRPALGRWWRELALVALVAAIAAAVLQGPSRSQPFSIDESRWIATSRYFWITFVDGDLFGPAWQPNYIVMTHPPLARYTIGLGLWLQGWEPDQLNGRYDSLRSRAVNERAGNVPSRELLADARRVTYLFAVAAVVLLYAVARQLGGGVAGLFAVAFALGNPLLTTVWTRALAESIVATYSLLALWLALRTLPRVTLRAAVSWQPLALGTALALAAATKLTGALGSLGLSLFVLVQQGFAIASTGRTAGLRYWVDVAIAATIVFVAVNPLLYLQPAERIVLLVQHRQDEMEFQRSTFSDQAVPDSLAARVQRVARRVFDTHATPHGSLSLAPDAPLVLVGLGLLAWRTACEIRGRRPGPALLFVCWSAATYAAITANLGFDSSHYYAPLVALNAVIVAVALEAGVRLGVRRWQRRETGPGGDPVEPLPQKTQEPTR